MGKYKINDITPILVEKIKDYMHHYKKDKKSKEIALSPKTINNTLDLVRQLFNSAVKARIYSGDNPSSEVKRLKKDNRRLRFLTREEADKLLTRLELMGNMQLHDMVLLSLHCGLRAGELYKLQWIDTDFANRKISIKDPKSGINRFANMTNGVYDMLIRRKNEAMYQYVFHTDKGEPLKEISNQYERIVEKLRFNDGITDVRNKVVFHTLRHTFASWLAIAGVDIFTIKELIGHSDIKMTMRYSHLCPEKFREAISVIDG